MFWLIFIDSDIIYKEARGLCNAFYEEVSEIWEAVHYRSLYTLVDSTSTEEEDAEEKEKSEPKFDIKAMPLHLQLYHAFLLVR